MRTLRTQTSTSTTSRGSVTEGKSENNRLLLLPPNKSKPRFRKGRCRPLRTSTHVCNADPTSTSALGKKSDFLFWIASRPFVSSQSKYDAMQSDVVHFLMARYSKNDQKGFLVNLSNKNCF